jgi:hypothetical protein
MIERSIRYTGPADLIAASLLPSIEWHKSNGKTRLGQILRRILPVRVPLAHRG